MVVKYLHKEYKSDERLFLMFTEDNLSNSDLVSDKTVIIPDIPDFPIYFGKARDDEKVNGFLELVHIIENYILNLERDVYMDECFWHSYLCLHKRKYLIEQYPEILMDEKNFKNIVLKKYDWENYIYKAVLAAQYVTDHVDFAEREKYYNLIMENMDLFNYIIKYEIFRNGNFLINILDIVDETGLSKVLKAKIVGRPDLGSDERYGRRVIFEFNKSYPIVLAPMLEKEELKEYFLKYLGYYYAVH